MQETENKLLVGAGEIPVKALSEIRETFAYRLARREAVHTV